MENRNYANLPARLRRIVKNYEYCVADVSPTGFEAYQITLKPEYSHRDGSKLFIYPEKDQTDNLIQFFKNIVRPSGANIQVALYGFKCPICGNYVTKGSNFKESAGLKVCIKCSLGS